MGNALTACLAVQVSGRLDLRCPSVMSCASLPRLRCAGTRCNPAHSRLPLQPPVCVKCGKEGGPRERHRFKVTVEGSICSLCAVAKHYRDNWAPSQVSLGAVWGPGRVSTQHPVTQLPEPPHRRMPHAEPPPRRRPHLLARPRHCAARQPEHEPQQQPQRLVRQQPPRLAGRQPPGQQGPADRSAGRRARA